MEYMQTQTTRQLFQGSYADYLDYCTEQHQHLFTEMELDEIQQDAYVLHLLALPKESTTF